MSEPNNDRRTLVRHAVLGALAAFAIVALFFAGRALAPQAIDFVVYHRAAQNLLAGRTDLYSASFALDPPMRYLYPPLFVLLVAPLGLLSYTHAFGLWFALLVLASIAGVAIAVRAWRPPVPWIYGLSAALLAGPALLYGLRSANVHLLLVLMTIAAVVAWGRGRLTLAAALVSVAGAIKLFPLFLLPFFVVLREWRLAARVAALSALLWVLPVAYFGPARSAELYRQWWSEVAGNVERLRRESRLDVSLESTVTRWLSAADYSQRIDHDYPQAHILNLPPLWARAVGRALVGLVTLLTVVAALRLAASVADRATRAATVGGLCMSTQLLVGPYTTLLYLSGWLLPALALPAAAAIQHPIVPRLERNLFVLGMVNLALVLAPGAGLHRVLETCGAHTLINAVLWGMSVWVACGFPRRRTTAAA